MTLHELHEIMQRTPNAAQIDFDNDAFQCYGVSAHSEEAHEITVSPTFRRCWEAVSEGDYSGLHQDDWREPEDLDELQTALTSPYGWGLPYKQGAVDWSSLPDFGGESPNPSDPCVLSWDEDRVLMGSCRDDLTIVSRDA